MNQHGVSGLTGKACPHWIAPQTELENLHEIHFVLTVTGLKQRSDYDLASPVA